MIKVLRIETKISKRRIKKELKDNCKTLIISKKPLKIKGITVIKDINKVLSSLKNKGKVNFVFHHFSSYLYLLTKTSLKELHIIKKSKRRVKRIEFLTYEQMELLQLYFESISNQEITFAKVKKVPIVIDIGTKRYVITSLDKTKGVLSVKLSWRKIIIKKEEFNNEKSS